MWYEFYWAAGSVTQIESDTYEEAQEVFDRLHADLPMVGFAGPFDQPRVIATDKSKFEYINHL